MSLNVHKDEDILTKIAKTRFFFSCLSSVVSRVNYLLITSVLRNI